MKRMLLFCTALLLLCLCACGVESAAQTVYEVEHNGRSFTVDSQKQTVTCEGQVYRYQIEGSRTEITYPDGATYWWTVMEHGGAGGWSDAYERGGRIPGDELLQVLGAETPRPPSSETRGGGGRLLFGLLAVGFGVWGCVSPHTAWYAAYGWRYKNAEPSDAALTAERVGGVVLILAGIFVFLLL